MPASSRISTGLTRNTRAGLPLYFSTRLGDFTGVSSPGPTRQRPDGRGGVVEGGNG